MLSDKGQKKIYLNSLGCARNQVDSEQMLEWLQAAGWRIVNLPEEATVIVINTCSFIEDAADESIDAVLALSAFKSKGVCQRLIVTGCLPERYREEIIDALPEVNIFLGTGAFDRIVDAAEGCLDGEGCLLPDPDRISFTAKHRIRFESATAFIKIAEGCDRHCTYCIIPQLRGHLKSRPIKDILSEAQRLLAEGVKEITLISQDTTSYGKDLPNNQGLDSLLCRLSQLPEARNAWIRFLYGHPESIESDVFRVVTKHHNLCPYFDIPIQHASSKMLKLMGRRNTLNELEILFKKIRSEVPYAVLRTTVMVGFPGETESDFKKLHNFIEKIGFDHLGVFVYSDSEDLPSHKLPNPVDRKIAWQRKKDLMEHQSKISALNNQKYLGRVLTVLVESYHKENIFLGRSIFQAPEVDGLIYLHATKDKTACRVGQFCRTKIVDTLEYDLVGEVA
jgi:ribosomal protein S12 methylthiotransferase